MNGRFEVPREFDSTDDKYLKIFSLTSLLVLMVMAALSVMACKLLIFFGVPSVPAIAVFGIITIAVTATTMIPIPADNYMSGGGNTVAQVIIKRFIRRRARCIYVKGYNQYRLDSEAMWLVREALDRDDSVLRYEIGIPQGIRMEKKEKDGGGK